MNQLCSFLFFVLLLHTPCCIHSSTTYDLFQTWCASHGKTYTCDEEKLLRFKIFQENYAYITQHNNNLAPIIHHYRILCHLMPLLILLTKSFKASRLGLSAGGTNKLIRMNRGSSTIPSSLDWRDKGAVTNVKDQGSCDEFVIDNKGMDTEDDYPYKSRETTCNKNKLNRHVVTIDGYVDVRENDEEQLLEAVADQPVSVGICGSERNFQLYSKGIFSGPCSTSLDHAVLIVGYGTENGADYWILKNSWGTQWGMIGYMHMQRNNGNSRGICGINMMPSYPTKTSPNPPPSPSPSPTKCSLLFSCSEGETCCCSWSLFGLCLSWKCCELDSAVCCDDHRHCCPQDYPICDTKRNLCLEQTGNYTLVKEFGNHYIYAKSRSN